jgi:hypothetical protein
MNAEGRDRQMTEYAACLRTELPIHPEGYWTRQSTNECSAAQGVLPKPFLLDDTKLCSLWSTSRH